MLPVLVQCVQLCCFFSRGCSACLSLCGAGLIQLYTGTLFALVMRTFVRVPWPAVREACKTQRTSAKLAKSTCTELFCILSVITDTAAAARPADRPELVRILSERRAVHLPAGSHQAVHQSNSLQLPGLYLCVICNVTRLAFEQLP